MRWNIGAMLLSVLLSACAKPVTTTTIIYADPSPATYVGPRPRAPDLSRIPGHAAAVRVYQDCLVEEGGRAAGLLLPNVPRQAIMACTASGEAVLDVIAREALRRRLALTPEERGPFRRDLIRFAYDFVCETARVAKLHYPIDGC